MNHICTAIVLIALLAAPAQGSGQKEVDTRRLTLVEENHAEVTRGEQRYTIDSYIIPFQQPYYVLVRSASSQPIKKQEAASIAVEYIAPRGCTTPISRREDLDDANADETQWLIGIEC